MTYTVEPLDDRALGCRVTATAKSGRYRITTDYVTDPDRAHDRDGLELQGAEGQGVRLQALRPLRPDAQRQRRRPGRQDRGQRNAGADSGSVAADRRPLRARRLRPRHRHHRRQPRLRGPGPQRARRRPAVPRRLQRLRRQGQRRPDPARRLARGLTSTLATADRRQPRADRAGRPAATTATSRSRSASATARPRRSARRAQTLGERFGGARARLRQGLAALRRASSSPRGGRTASRASRWSSLLDEYYLSAFYVKAAEDKTFPRRRRGGAGLAVGPVAVGRRSRNTYFGSYREVFGATSTRRGPRSTSPATARPRAP